MKVIMLSGWGQDAASLSHLYSPSHALDYQSFDSYDSFVQSIPTDLQDVDVVVGWSLGGQIAYRLLSEGVVNALHLILLAPPYQYVNDSAVSCGIASDEFELFQRQVSRQDGDFIRRFQSLITHGDVREKHLKHLPQLHAHNEYKDYWLDYLGRQSCKGMTIDSSVRVTFIFGSSDCITSMDQGYLFKEQVPHSDLLLWDLCSHAPHLHDPHSIRNIIEQ